MAKHFRPCSHNCIARVALENLPDDAVVRVTRVLVYEGPAHWVRSTLNAPSAALRGVGAADFPLSEDRQLYCTREEIERLD